jgi:Toprim-like
MLEGARFLEASNLREDTLYGATGGGMGPSTIAALKALLGRIAMLPGALFCSATDANGAGDRFAERHRSLARQFAVPFERLPPPIDGADWNDVLRERAEARASAPSAR